MQDEKFRKEFEEACTSLEAFLDRRLDAQGPKHFYDFLHFSPLKVIQALSFPN